MTDQLPNSGQSVKAAAFAEAFKGHQYSQSAKDNARAWFDMGYDTAAKEREELLNALATRNDEVTGLIGMNDELRKQREELRAMLSEAECPMCEPGVAPVDPGCPWCAKRRDLGAAP